MSCFSISSAIQGQCDNAVGGVSEALIANYDPTSITRDENGVITAIAEATVWYAFKWRKGQATLDEELVVNDESGNQWQNTFTMNFVGQEQKKRVAIQALSQSETMALVHLNTGGWKLIGSTMPLTASSANATSGGALTDKNGYTIALQSNEVEMAEFVDDEIVEAIEPAK